MRYHKAHLTRRLILDISADSEIEENMVEWLRVSAAISSRFLGVRWGAGIRGKRICLQESAFSFYLWVPGIESDDQVLLKAPLPDWPSQLPKSFFWVFCFCF